MLQTSETVRTAVSPNVHPASQSRPFGPSTIREGRTVTFDVGSPEFSSDGKYLFFVSERSFNPTYGQTEWNHTYSDMERIYLVTLAAATKSPMAPKSDEVKPRDDKAAISGAEAKAVSDTDKDKDGD